MYIDPGHGGRDPGAVDGTGGTDQLYTEEEDLTLTVGMLLYDALGRCGVGVGISRTADVYPSLAERAIKANEWDADIFVSIHFNAAVTAGAKGMEILHYPYSAEGRKLGVAIYDQLAPITPWGDRTVRVDTRGLYVLRATNMPAVIVEYDFITNEEAERLVVTEAYQAAAAEATARGICDYLGVAYVAPDGNDTIAADPDEVHIIVARGSKAALVKAFAADNDLAHSVLVGVNVDDVATDMIGG